MSRSAAARLLGRRLLTVGLISAFFPDMLPGLSCFCSIGSIQNVAYAGTHDAYRLPLPVAGFFILPFLAALFFGRVFCGGVCPMGAMQDLLLLRPIKIPAMWRAPLETIPYLYLGAAVLLAATTFFVFGADLAAGAANFVVFFTAMGEPDLLLTPRRCLRQRERLVGIASRFLCLDFRSREWRRFHSFRCSDRG